MKPWCWSQIMTIGLPMLVMVAWVGVANGNIIICKRYMYAFKMNKKPIVVDRFFAFERANASPHLFCVDRMLGLRRLENGLKQLKEAKREAWLQRFAAWRRPANCVKQVSCRVSARPRAPKGASGAECLRQVTAGTWFSAICLFQDLHSVAVSQ